MQAVEASARQRLSELQAQAQEVSSQLQAAQQVVEAITGERDALLKQAEVRGVGRGSYGLTGSALLVHDLYGYS
jgi:hypothetical protein